MDENESASAPTLDLPGELHILPVRGKQKVLAMALRLRELAARCRQAGLIDHLEYSLSVPYFGSKLPCVLLVYAKADASVASPQFERDDPPAPETPALLAAVLLHEYQVAWFRTGAYIPADPAGDWTILAPAPFRASIARQAAAFLLREDATLVLLSSSAPPATEVPVLPGGSDEATMARSARCVLRTLPLGSSLEQTLDRMGSHTRRNLRLVRRRAQSELQATYVAESQLDAAEFLTMNREGFYPVPDAVARWRYESVHKTPGGFLAGVRTHDHVWIALLGGRRFQGTEGAVTTVDWQLNRTGFARYSPGSLIRSFLIEHEIARGTAFLRFEGGTPHSMRSAFAPEVLREWLYASPGWTPARLRRLANVLPKGNLLRDFLTSPEVHWRERAIPS